MNHLPFDSINLGKYTVQFASNESELEQVFRLRFQVFYLEMQGQRAPLEMQGQRAPQDSCLKDVDAYDAQCQHLLLIFNETQEIVGTYRLVNYIMAQKGIGFYTASEFDLSGFSSDILEEGVEIGRACIAQEHRNSRALFALWKGLATYMQINKVRYFFGCASILGISEHIRIESQKYLELNNYWHKNILLQPLSGFAQMPDDSCFSTRQFVGLPMLFQSYLKYGAFICSLPAFDRVFNTTDFVVLFDLCLIPDRKYRLFYGTDKRFIHA